MLSTAHADPDSMTDLPGQGTNTLQERHPLRSSRIIYDLAARKTPAASYVCCATPRRTSVCGAAESALQDPYLSAAQRAVINGPLRYVAVTVAQPGGRRAGRMFMHQRASGDDPHLPLTERPLAYCLATKSRKPGIAKVIRD
jgi:hypothetical protein